MLEIQLIHVFSSPSDYRYKSEYHLYIPYKTRSRINKKYHLYNIKKYLKRLLI